MDDIRRQDLRLFFKEMVAPGRIFMSVLAGAVFFLFWKVTSSFEAGIPLPALISWVGIVFAHTAFAWSASLKHRFLNKRFQALWNGCQDRLARFEDVLKKLRREQIAELSEMPKTIRRVADSLYMALRRSDMIAHEVQSSEQGLYASPQVWTAPSHDPQSKELY